MQRLTGKRAIVTGGARGIGRGIAEGFAAEGADVAIFDVGAASAAEAVVNAIEAQGRHAFYLQCDVSDWAAVETAVGEVVRELGGVDVLVNNAGIVHEALVEDLDPDDWDRVIAVNLRGTFLCTRAVLPQLLRQGGGRIINIASQLGQIGGSTMAAYSASKAGVIGLTRSLAREVSSRNVLVNAIAPGPVETAMLESESEDWKRAKLASLPIGRFASVAEIVPTAVFLASDDSTYYTGQTLGPNGGDVML